MLAGTQVPQQALRHLGSPSGDSQMPLELLTSMLKIPFGDFRIHHLFDDGHEICK